VPLLTRSRSLKPGSPAAPPDVASLLLVVHDGAAAELLDAHPVLVVGGRLAEQHRRQWAAEDLSRSPGVSDAAVADTKRRIDALNLLRAQCVDEIDAWCDTHLPESSVDVPLHTETVGSVVDRLAIAAVRASHLGTARAGAQLGELAHAYSILIADIAAGRRRVPSWRTLKAYGTAR
jgi:hypothetical protein